MTDPNSAIVTTTIRTAQLLVVVAGLTLLNSVLLVAWGPARWTMLLNGAAVALSGFLILKTREVLRLTALSELRAWMRPVGYAMCALSIPCFAFGVLAVIRLRGGELMNGDAATASLLLDARTARTLI